MQREVAYLNTKILKFTELIMAFVEFEALVRSQGVADNWHAMNCQKLSGVFFSLSSGYLLASIKGTKLEEKQHGLM